jgi:hypothetical protein
MSLWGKDANSAPTWLSDDPEAPMQNNKENAVYIDNTSNTTLTSSGWNLYKEYGNGRKYIETLVSMHVDPNSSEGI